MAAIGGSYGTFGWIVLSTADPAAAVRFYRRAFGWQEAEAGGLLLMLAGAKPVAAVMDYRQNDRIQREPQNWLPMVRVRDVDESIVKVESLGGSVIVPIQDVGVGRAAAVRGVTGEAIGLWETPGPLGGEPILMDPGICPWFELVTPDPERAIPFYKALFGWRIADEGGYTFIGNDEGQFGGIVKLAGDWEDYAFHAAIGRARGEKLSVPPHWMIFFGVDDCDHFTDQVEALGGQVTTRPEPLHTVGTFAVLRDPQGVYFSVLSKR
ncbi:MAG TPA: VOC family protein [Polyangiaceae bacterium]|nr:VOC family protein [Polyangiaceae bacterium]